MRFGGGLRSGGKTGKLFKIAALLSGQVRPQQGTEICNFGEASPLDFFNFLQWIFPFSSDYMCKMWRKLPDFRSRFLGKSMTIQFRENFPCHPGKISMSPKAIPAKATLPDIPLFSVFDRPHVPHFPLFFAAFCCFPYVCCMPGVDPHVLHILWIAYEGNWDDRLCQGRLWVQPKIVQFFCLKFCCHVAGS